MLVLSRKPMEQIRIGSDIILTVLRSRTNRVTIGIDAPQGLRVCRNELIVGSVDNQVDDCTAVANEGRDSERD